MQKGNYKPEDRTLSMEKKILFFEKTLSREELSSIWENFISRSSFNEVCYQEVSDLKDIN